MATDGRGGAVMLTVHAAATAKAFNGMSASKQERLDSLLRELMLTMEGVLADQRIPHGSAKTSPVIVANNRSCSSACVSGRH